MQITNNYNCRKPSNRMVFKGNEESGLQRKKVRYKHFEQMEDSVLKAHSVARAYQSTQESGKMRLFKAIPGITATIIGTSLALSQPGKLSAKAARGLGFLVLLKGADKISQSVYDSFNKKSNNETKDKKALIKDSAIKFATAALACTGAVIGSLLLLKGGKSLLNKVNPNISKFFKGEAKTLAKEINNSKVGKYFEKNINPFISKHQHKFDAASDIIPFIAAFAGIKAQDKLGQSLSKDLCIKAKENYEKGKIVQQLAKEKFDEIEAQEV